MYKIKKGDTVYVTKGRDRGKKGRVLEVLRERGRALVEGVNLVKKHKRRTQQDQKGGIVSIEASINISNLANFCGHCNKAARTGFIILKDGTKARICKACKEVI